MNKLLKTILLSALMPLVACEAQTDAKLDKVSAISEEGPSPTKEVVIKAGELGGLYIAVSYTHLTLPTKA